VTADPHGASRRQIAEQAALWLVTFQSEEVSAARRAEFVDWLRASPLHIAELLRICQVQRGLAGFKGWQGLAALPAARHAEVIALLPANAPAAERRPSRRLSRVALLAAGVAALCVTASLLFTRLNQVDFTTQHGERREVTLADLSVVELAPDSQVSVRYRARERLITLDRGAALFRVTKDPGRPFIVQAGRTRVRAVGTVFNVDRGAGSVSVAVVEGRVAVSQQSPARFAHAAQESTALVLSLKANERVSIDQTGASTVSKVDLGIAAGSAQDELAFENESVGEVVRRFNSKNAMKIDIRDARLAARRISGVFHSRDPQSFVSFVQAAADVQVSQLDAQHIVLGSPDTASTGTAP
jgi:transmembrane sensor